MLNAEIKRERVNVTKKPSDQYSLNKSNSQTNSFAQTGQDLAAPPGQDVATPKGQHLPDVALEATKSELSSLLWVGMSQIETPVLWVDGEGQVLRIPGRVDAWVSLDLKPARGIHMSRLYLRVQKILADQPLSVSALRSLTGEFLNSHQELSGRSRVAVDVTLPIRRKALISENMGWRNYPVIVVAEQASTLSKGLRLFLEVKIAYSSTCPASAALSRQLSAAEFLRVFPQGANPERIAEWLGTTQGMPATPHAQRSEARVLVEVNLEVFESEKNSNLPVLKVIDLIETALQTPVQAAVKREDEQEFARLNSQNLMFCEDAARRVRESLEKSTYILDYFGRFQHFESLHPHNAVSFIQRDKNGLSGFYGQQG